jgi:hypothetical protein
MFQNYIKEIDLLDD